MDHLWTNHGRVCICKSSFVHKAAYAMTLLLNVQMVWTLEYILICEQVHVGDDGFDLPITQINK